MATQPIHLPEDRYFDPDQSTRTVAQHLYQQVRDLPLLCTHGHVDPRMFADPDYSFGTPTQLILIPDHYIFRMLYSQGVPLEKLAIPRRDGGPTETDHRAAWQVFADHYHLFRGTPTGAWLAHEFREVFGVQQRLSAETAQAVYDQIAERLATPEFRPRRLFERFNIEVMSTTDPAHSRLEHHQSLQRSGWKGRIIPTFRPDGVVNLDAPGWRRNLDLLSEASGTAVDSYPALIRALENRRAYFRSLGAVATDHAAVTPYTEELSPKEADSIFGRALRGEATPADATRFTGHMLMESARMSIEDGLVMQLHPGSFRNHNPDLFAKFGPDMGADIPAATEYTRNLRPLLSKYGNDTRLTLILFMLDESALARELAPLAGHYPALRLGPPWWFHDSINGMTRFRQRVSETAGLYNTVGFNDDTRAFPSIPARHDLARRVDANWLAGLVARGIVALDEAEEMMHACAYDLAEAAYKLG